MSLEVVRLGEGLVYAALIGCYYERFADHVVAIASQVVTGASSSR